MGTLVYGAGGFEFEVDDRLMAHIQVVIGAKLRRNEPFYFSWVADDVRSTVWIQAAIPLRFCYTDAKRHEINRDWLEALTVSANSPGGLTPLDEPSATSATVAAGNPRK
jgi:hypothetical protein